MDIDLELLRKRHSVRAYSPEPIAVSLVNRLKSEITFVNSHEAGLNFTLCLDDNAPFKGFSRSYGMFRNADNYIAAIIDPSFDHAEERAGYFAQQLVIECTALGLGTCFVGGTFSRRNVNARLEVYEKVPFVVTVGNPEEEKTTFVGRLTKTMAHRKQMSPREFYDGDEEEYTRALMSFPWLDKALEALACAPSALNRRPVRLKMIESNGHSAIIAYNVSQNQYSPVDLGIAKFNIAAIVPGLWDWGERGEFHPET